MSCLETYVEHKLKQRLVEEKKKVADPKNLANAQVVIGGMMYPVRDLDFIQDPDRDYPHVRASAVLNPFYGSIVPLKIAKSLEITNVIFNPPATIVFWSDKTKTVVKCDTSLEEYDPEKGMAMAFAKKLMGENKYEYYNVFRHWLKKWNKQNKPATTIDDHFAPGEWDGDFANF